MTAKKVQLRLVSCIHHCWQARAKISTCVRNAGSNRKTCIKHTYKTTCIRDTRLRGLQCCLQKTVHTEICPFPPKAHELSLGSQLFGLSISSRWNLHCCGLQVRIFPSLHDDCVHFMSCKEWLTSFSLYIHLFHLYPPIHEKVCRSDRRDTIWTKLLRASSLEQGNFETTQWHGQCALPPFAGQSPEINSFNSGLTSLQSSRDLNSSSQFFRPQSPCAAASWTSSWSLSTSSCILTKRVRNVQCERYRDKVATVAMLGFIFHIWSLSRMQLSKSTLLKCLCFGDFPFSALAALQPEQTDQHGHVFWFLEMTWTSLSPNNGGNKQWIYKINHCVIGIGRCRTHPRTWCVNWLQRVAVPQMWSFHSEVKQQNIWTFCLSLSFFASHLSCNKLKIEPTNSGSNFKYKRLMQHLYRSWSSASEASCM